MGDYQIMPALSDEDYLALKNDIAEHGILVAIEFDEAGNVLDGHHRLRAWKELKAEGLAVADYPSVIRPKLTEPEKRNHIRALNALRRHLTKEQRIELWADMRQDGASYRQIAEASGVAHTTVMRATGANAPVQPEAVVGKDGKKRKPRKPKPKTTPGIVATTTRSREQALDGLQGLNTEGLPDKMMTTRQFSRKARELEKEQAREDDPPEPVNTPTLQLYLGDFRESLSEISPGSVSLIFTDPPYAQEFLHLWEPLAELAARVLRPGGLLISYTGQYHLFDVITSLAKHLEYVWLGAILTHGPKNITHVRKIYGKCKPLLFFSNGIYEPLDFVDDFIDDDRPEKEAHEWQQGIIPARYYIEHLTRPGDTVLDPFLGSGTTGEAALSLRRTFIGAEQEPLTFKIAKNRLEGL